MLPSGRLHTVAPTHLPYIHQQFHSPSMFCYQVCHRAESGGLCGTRIQTNVARVLNDRRDARMSQNCEVAFTNKSEVK